MSAVRQLGGAIGLLWVVLFVAVAGTYLSTWVVGLRAPAIVIWALPLLGWAVLRPRGPRDRLDLAVAVALVAHLAVSLASRDVTGSLEASGMALAFALLFWAGRDVAGSPAWRERAATGVVIGLAPWLWAAAAAWLWEKATWVALGGGMPNLESAQVFVWGTANAYPVLVLLALAFAAQISATRTRRLARLAIAVPAVVVVPLSAGRAGWLGLAVALSLVLFLAPPTGGGLAARLRSAVGRVPGRWPAIVTGLVLAAVGIALVFGDGIGRVLAANLGERARIWGQAIGIFTADPLTGSGPGTFPWVRLEHVPALTDPVGVVLAHDVPLQTLADGGLLLGAAFAVLAAAWAWSAAVSAGERSPARTWAVAGVVGVAAASLLDDFSPLPAVIAGVVVLAAWALPPVPARTLAGQRWRPWLLPGVAAIVGLATALPTVQVETARLAADGARWAAVDGRWSDAADRFAAAARSYPAMGAYHLGLGFTRATLGDLDGARQAYERARAIAPGDPRPAGALAALTGDPADRLALLEEATRRSTDARYAWRLAEELRTAARPAEADVATARAVLLRPDLLRHLPADGPSVAHLAELVAAAAERSGSLGARPVRQPVWDVGLVAGSLPADAPAAWRAVLAAADGRSAEASRLVVVAREQAPHDPMTHLAEAFVAAAACDLEQADAALRRIGASNEESPAGLRIERDTVYRDLGLGAQQPPSAGELPAPVPWPLGLVDVPSSCG